MIEESGKVFLVGAGPGDPGLITVRGAEILRSADVVIYDYLANPLLLEYCPQAETIFVGKKAADHRMTQEQINALLVERGRSGKRVVRLKGGDPFVFGRGGEECEALRAAGIPFEVVPGITAAIAVPAYAGIPVTHRDFNSSFTILTGHEKEKEYGDEHAEARDVARSASNIDWSVIAKLPCIAFYMGLKTLPRICSMLIEHGMPPDTPAACIRWGTMPRQQTVAGTLADLPQKVAEAKVTPPAMTIVGKVVSLRPVMNWFEARPLFGQTIAVTRTRQQASELSAGLRELGAHVIEAPTIELSTPGEWSEVDEVLEKIDHYDWAIFTSVNGVKYAKRRLIETGSDARAFSGVRIAAVGDATADAIRDELCLKVDLCPKAFVAEALADELEKMNEVRGRTFLLLRADIARPILRERLIENGAMEVRDVSIYETRPATTLPPALLDALAAQELHWITFTSSSTARNLVELLGPDYKSRLAGVKIASIGPVTTSTLKDLGLKPTIQAQTSNVQGLVSAILSVNQEQFR